MAKDAFGDILVLGLLGGAAYLAWNWWSSLSVAAPAAAVPSTTPTTPATSLPEVAPQAGTTAASQIQNLITTGNPGTTPFIPLSQQLQLWASANGMGITYVENGNTANPPGQLDADHWSAIYTTVTGNTIDGTLFDSTFFPNGRPASASSNPVYTSTQFVQMLAATGGAYAGLSGPAPRLIPVPVILGGQRHTMNLPAGTTPAQLQAMLRGR
jgi:hypothetical protein